MFGFIDSLLEEDLKTKFARKPESKDVQITYDLLPDGTIQNFTVKPCTDWVLKNWLSIKAQI